MCQTSPFCRFFCIFSAASFWAARFRSKAAMWSSSFGSFSVTVNPFYSKFFVFSSKITKMKPSNCCVKLCLFVRFLTRPFVTDKLLVKVGKRCGILVTKIARCNIFSLKTWNFLEHSHTIHQRREKRWRKKGKKVERENASRWPVEIRHLG